MLSTKLTEGHERRESARAMFSPMTNGVCPSRLAAQAGAVSETETRWALGNKDEVSI